MLPKERCKMGCLMSETENWILKKPDGKKQLFRLFCVGNMKDTCDILCYGLVFHSELYRWSRLFHSSSSNMDLLFFLSITNIASTPVDGETHSISIRICTSSVLPVCLLNYGKVIYVTIPYSNVSH